MNLRSGSERKQALLPPPQRLKRKMKPLLRKQLMMMSDQLKKLFCKIKGQLECTIDTTHV